jgi:hypothetical protein
MVDVEETGCKDGRWDITGVDAVPVAGFGISGVEPSGN